MRLAPYPRVRNPSAAVRVPTTAAHRAFHSLSTRTASSSEIESARVDSKRGMSADRRTDLSRQDRRGEMRARSTGPGHHSPTESLSPTA